MSGMVPMFVAIPLGVAFLLPLLPKRFRASADILGNLTLAALVILSAAAVYMRVTVIYHMGGWVTPVGIDLRLDGLSALMLITINVIGFAATLFSVDYMRMYTGRQHYYGLVLFMVAGMNGVVLAADLFNLYVFMEIAAIASYALVGFGCEHEELEACFKYMVLGSVASSLILIGVACMYALTGSLNMSQVATRLGTSGWNVPTLVALALFVSGFGLKAALVPFHAWLPDAHPSAPAPVSALLSGVVIKALGVYVLARLTFNVFGVAPADVLGASQRVLLALRVLGALSMVVGVMLAIGQWDMKRLFAYHSISQIGYVVLALGIGTPLGLAGALFHMANHSVFKSLLFLNAGAVEYSRGTRDLKQLGGLNREMPVTGCTSLIASMSIAGVPPFNGFWSKLLIVVACVQAGHHAMAVWAVLVSLLTLASFLKVQRYAFFAEPAPARRKRPVPLFMQASMVMLALLCVAMAFLVLSGWDRPLVIQPGVDALRRGAIKLIGTG